MRAHRLILLLLLGGPAIATAQEPEPTLEAERYPSWRTSYFPYLKSAANDGPMLVFRLRHWRPAEYEGRTTYDAAFNFDGGITARGSRYVAAQFKAPNLWQGWRLSVLGVAERQVRYGFFGLGNETVKDDDLVTEENPFLYRMRRSRYRGSVEVTRHLKGALQLALLTEYEHTHFTSLPGQSAFVSTFPSGELDQDDVTGRLALIYDTRDNEYNTQRGLLLEAGTQVGSGGDGYTRQYAMFRGYLPLREGTVVAARIGGSGMGGTPPLDARFVLPGWENQVPVIGGEYSNRGLDTGRLTGTGTLFGNLEVRHDLLSLGDLGAVTLLGFVDVGRVFEEESFRLTTEDMKVGAGGGVALRILRASIFVFNFAGGSEGFNFSAGTGWMF
jgi:outer membrane protein assembly factor BamA